MTTVHGEAVAGRWRIGELIGRGAVADVHRGVDATTGDPVAVKVLRHADPAQRTRFEREALALEALDHPAIVRVLGHGTVDERPFLVLEHVAGGSLADRIATGPMTEDEVAELGAALADALEHAHGRGVIHRDVKPSNVLLDEAGGPRLADFGVAQLDGADTLTATGFTVGTAGYLAPEQVRGEPVGPPADVYALGLVLLEAVTGERAYPGSGVTAAMARLERPPEVPTTLSRPLAERLRAMTAMDPADRPSTASVRADLSAFGMAPADGGTALLPVVDDPTEVVAVAGPVASPAGAPAATATTTRRGPAVAWRPIGIAVLCFLAGFLLVALLRTGVQATGFDELVPTTTASTVATATTAVPTTAPPTTAPPTTAAPVDDDDGGRGGNQGNGRGRGNDDD